MSLPIRTARTFWLKKNAKWSAVRPAPAPAGGALPQHYNPLTIRPRITSRGFLFLLTRINQGNVSVYESRGSRTVLREVWG
jgi:hypothetical protein